MSNIPTDAHAYCDNCREIREVSVEELVHGSRCGKFVGGDITCKTCAWIVACIYQPKEADNV